MEVAMFIAFCACMAVCVWAVAWATKEKPPRGLLNGRIRAKCPHCKNNVVVTVKNGKVR